VVEKVATEKTLAVAQATGAHVHICHASFPEIVELVEQSRRDGVKATVETCPQYLIFTEDQLGSIGGPLKCTPPVRDRESVEKLWQFLSEGRIDFLVTDHSPATENEKQGRAFSELWGGINGIQFLFQALFTEGVCKRGFSLQKLVELYSEAPARFSGLYPQRGDIAIGGEATFVIFDPEVEYVVTEKSMLTKNKQSPYMGMRFQGLVESTWIRGVNVYEHKNERQDVRVNRGFGKFVKFRQNR
jgi:allantoinase